MAEQDIDTLVNSRRGYKASNTRARNRTVTVINDLGDGDDPILAEQLIEDWKKKLDKYSDCDEVIQSHVDYDRGHTDNDVDKAEMEYFRAKSQVIAKRREFDLQQAQEQAEAAAADQNPAQGNNNAQGQNNGQGQNARLPKVDAKRPETLQEDCDHRVFKRWRPLWRNYANLTMMTDRHQQVQVAMFWECCSPGFLSMVQHSLGIRPETQRPVNEILDMIEAHLRSLRNPHLDMRDLLAVRQQDGQDYSNFCTKILELADYADAANINQDGLLIGLLLQGLKSETDKAKVMEKNPRTFDEARRYILELETARRGAKAIASSSNSAKLVAANKSNYKKTQSKKKEQESRPDKCTRFGAPASDHSRNKCPAMNTVCDSCGKKGHLQSVCFKGNKNTSNSNKKKQLSVIRVCATQTSECKTSNQVDVQLSSRKKTSTVTLRADTGADATVLGLSIYENSLQDKFPLRSPANDIAITGVDGNILKQAGTLILDMKIQGQRIKRQKIYVCHKINDGFLSRDACKGLNIISERFPLPMTAAANSCNPAKTMSATDQATPKLVELSVNKDQNTFDQELENWIKNLPDNPSEAQLQETDSKLRAFFNDVFEDSEVLKPMTGPIVGDPMVITLKEDAKPFAIHTARQVPYALRDKVKETLDELLSKDVIEPVGDIPTEWCHPIVVILKPGGSIRLCVDLGKLNSQVMRSTHPTKTPNEAIQGFKPTHQWFCKLDLKNGYWQLLLDEESRKLCVFITPEGKFRFKRAPMGFISTGDSYSYRGDVAMQGLPVEKIIDDIGGGHETFHGLIRLVCGILERCRKYNLTVNAKKSILCAKQIDFVGYKISHNSIEADPKKLDAIQDFAIPANRTDLRSFMGLVNQLSSFSHEIAATAAPLRGLLATKNEFLWLPEHAAAFEQVKKALVSAPVLGMFDPKAPTALHTDASRLNGLGYVLLQQQGEHWRLIQCGSRFLTDTETRYAMVELESLAIYWAIKKCHIYLAGLEHFEVITDHKELKTMFNKQALDAIENPRVQNYRSRLTSYNFTVDWKKGKLHNAPDALSRMPVTNPEEDEVTCEDVTRDDDPIKLHLSAINTQSNDLILEEIRKLAKEDKEYQRLKNAVATDTVKKNKNGYVSLFKKFTDELSIDDQLVLRGTQIVIPPSAIKDTIRKLHASHQGIVRTKRRARQTVFWPGMTSDLTNTVVACPDCAYYRPSNVPEPLTQDSLPTRPFEVTGADLFSYGNHEYLVYADRYSGYPYVAKYNNSPSTTMIIKELRHFFALTGIPNILRTDGGPQFASATMREYLKEIGVTWIPSSPHHHQSNGFAEAMVKSVKHVLAKTGGDINSQEFADGMLELRNTPREDGLSPAQRLFRRPLRTRVPIHESVLNTPLKDTSEADAKRLRNQKKKKNHYDRNTRGLPTIATGSHVFVQDPASKKWNRSALVNGRNDEHNYCLTFEDTGRVTWRNRKFLNLKVRPDEQPATSSENPNTEKIPRRSTRNRRSPSRYTAGH